MRRSRLEGKLVLVVVIISHLGLSMQDCTLQGPLQMPFAALHGYNAGMDSTIETLTTVKLTCWPSPQDYNEAVQNPHITLTDAELKLGQPELSELGLPRPRSGNFATIK